MPATSTLLLLKLTLAPGLIGVASLLMARLGPHVGGIVAALPAVSGPILLLYAIEQGVSFTAAAAKTTLLGTVALLAYTTVYARVARRFPSRRAIVLCLLLGYAAYFATAIGLDALSLPSPSYLPLAVSAVYFGIALLPRISPEPAPRASVPQAVRLLLLRMVIAAALVWALTDAARHLGPGWSGLLTSFPVIGTVMLVASHLEQGLGLALGWLRGFLWGLYGYVVFVSVVAYGVERLGVAAAFGLGVAGAALTQEAMRRAYRRSQI